MSCVLVTDGMQRKSLAAVRALGAAGERVVAAEWTALAAALFSKHAGRARSPHPREGERALAAGLARICASRGADVLLPMEESTLLAVLRHRDLLPPSVRLPFPSLEQVLEARDKARLLARAASLGIPIPRTAVLAGPGGSPLLPFSSSPPRATGAAAVSTAPAALPALTIADLSRFPLPAVVKPRISSGAVGVRYADRLEQLERAAGEVSSRYENPLVQERLPASGSGIGVSVLMGDGGRVLAIFSHRRLREYPVSGGASTLRESIRHPEAEAATVRLLRSMDWRGVAMAEFKEDARGGPAKLLELNPRFWGSLALPLKCGINFPQLLVRWARGEDTGGPPPYRLGVRARWSLPGDILHFLRSPARFRMDPPVWRFHGKKLFDDVWEPTDPWPVLGTLLSLLPFMLDPDLRRFLRR